MIAMRKRFFFDATHPLDFKIACAFERAVMEQLIDKNTHFIALWTCNAIHR